MGKKFILFCFSLFTFHFSFSQSWQWGKSAIGFGNGHSVASDELGNCYLTGYYLSNDTLNFSDSILINPPHNNLGNSMFITKFDNSGNLLWIHQSINFGNLDYANGGIVAVDNSGNAYVNATYLDTVIIGSDIFVFNSITENYYIAKYGTNGTFRWASSAIINKRDTGGIASNYISTDSYGNVFVTGLFNADTVYFGSQYILGNDDIVFSFLVKYDSTGNVLWADASIGHSYEYNEGDGMCVTNDRNGNAYITGEFEDSIWFGSYELITVPPHYAGDAFLVKYSATGRVLWAKQAYIPSANCESSGAALTTDASGNIYVAGGFLDTVAFGAYTLVSNNIYPESQLSIFLVKYDSNGTVLWAKEGEVLDSNGWGVGSLSIDNYKHIYLSGGGGKGHCKIAFGTDTLSLYDTAKYDAASIILEFDSNGNVLCSSIIPGGGEFTNSITSDSSGNHVYFGSTTGTEMILGNDTVTPFTYHDAVSGINYSPFAARWEGCDEATTVNKIPANDKIGVKVYPNPNNGNFILSLININEKCTVEIYNILGKKIFIKTLSEKQNNEINLAGQPNGVYLYRVLKEDGNLVGGGKVIIEK